MLLLKEIPHDFDCPEKITNVTLDRRVVEGGIMEDHDPALPELVLSLLSIYFSIDNISRIKQINNSSDSWLFQGVYIPFVIRVGTHDYRKFSNLSEEKFIQEITICFINAAIHIINLWGVLP